MPPSGFEPFLATILDRPGEDGPRLVYADWLEEQGDADRAEFIRVQIELAYLPDHDPKRDRLIDRESRLRNRHGEVWRADIPEWARDGALVGMGVAMRSQLWRFRERTAPGEIAP